MVSYKEILASNALINDVTAPRVAVFVGGTSGIGKCTLKALVATGVSVRIYLVGRKNSEERMSAFIQELSSVNPKAEVIWTEGEVSLLAETKRVCEDIKAKESYIDLLFLTTGYAPFGAREETPEGVDISQSLEYYTRMLFVQNLLPVLAKSEAPRVVSVLCGGLESTSSLNLDDLDLKQPGNFSIMKLQTHYGGMTTMFMDKLADENPNITFVHSWPGWVDTGNIRRGLGPSTSWIMGWIVWLVLEPLVHLFSFSDDESGQRHLFQSTSAAFGGRGTPWKGKSGVNSRQKQTNGLFLVNFKCNCTPNAKVVPLLREKARGKVWDHTQEIFKPYL